MDRRPLLLIVCVVVLAACPLGRGNKQYGDACEHNNQCAEAQCEERGKFCTKYCQRNTDCRPEHVCMDHRGNVDVEGHCAPPPAVAEPSAQAEPQSQSARDELARLDQRKPVPLQPMMAWHQKQNMMKHLVAIQRITAGVAREDWDEVADASALIESSPQMQQMCEHMGAGAEGFTEMALDFHRRADAIGQAASVGDGTAVLTATSHTLQACTACHAAYRQEVVDAATWEARSGSTHDPAKMHHGDG